MRLQTASYACALGTLLVSGCAGSGIPLGPQAVAQGIQLYVPQASSTNAVENGSFDTGKLAPWKSCGAASSIISKLHPYNGKYDALTGSVTTKSEIKGWSAICQRVTVPAGGTLTAELYRRTNEPSEKYAYQEVALADSSGKPATVLSKTNTNHDGWAKESWSLRKYAGKDVTLFFGVYGSGRAKYYDTQFIDDVTLVASTPGALTVTPTSLTFSSSDSQTITATESNYTGSLRASSSDLSVATVGPVSGNGPKATYKVVPVAGGTATISVENDAKGIATVAVTVANGVITVSSTGANSPRGGAR